MEKNKALIKRENILNGKMSKVILMIVLPLVFYNLCNYLYGIFDMMIVEKCNIGDAADIVVLDQIKNMISTIGGALATGGGIIIARKYGEGNISYARKSANTLFSIALIVAGLTLIFIPIGVPFLKMLNTDKSTIDNAIGYFYVQIAVLAITTMNNAFIAVEKSKGNTALLFFLNLMVIAIKIGLTLIFVLTPLKSKVTMTWLAIATLTAQLSMFTYGMVHSMLPKNILRITFKGLNLSKEILKSIFLLAFPVFLGRFLFTFGKVFVNSQATKHYGKMCVGALGISNTIAGLLTNIINSFEDGSSTIVSQNLGNNNGKRIKELFKWNFIYLVIISVVGTICLIVFQNQIVEFFAGKNKPEYNEMIINIVKWERMDLVFTALSGVGCAIFYGFGKTRVTMAISMSTLFLFRIPSLLLMMYVFKIDYEACGIAMFISNTLSGLIAFTYAFVFIKKLPNNKKYNLLF